MMEIKAKNGVRLGRIEKENDYTYFIPYENIKMTEYMLSEALKIIKKVS